MSEIFLEKEMTKLSLAILLVDDYTNTNPIGNVQVSLEDRNEKPIKNLSQYYLFIFNQRAPEIIDDSEMDVCFPDGDYIVQVKSDYYLENTDLKFEVSKCNIDIVENGQKKPLDPKNPSKIVRLTPDADYPFNNGVTLIRGILYDDSKKEKISNATVEVLGTGIKTRTSKKGEFVLYFLPNVQKGVGVKDELVTVNGDVNINLKVEKEGETIFLKSIKVIEEFNTLSIQIFGNKLYIGGELVI